MIAPKGIYRPESLAQELIGVVASDKSSRRLLRYSCDTNTLQPDHVTADFRSDGYDNAAPVALGKTYAQMTRPTINPTRTAAGASHERRLQLYGYGMTDLEIAKRSGVSNSTIKGWRDANGLPRNREPHAGNPLSGKQEAERMSLWKRGHSDREIADRVHVTIYAIQQWRGRYKLKANRKPVCTTPGFQPMLEQRMKLYRLGRTDAQIAEAQGCALKAVQQWRYKRALERNDGKPNPDGPARLVSMDADLGEGGFNRHASIADDAAAAWLEEMGATKW